MEVIRNDKSVNKIFASSERMWFDLGVAPDEAAKDAAIHTGPSLRTVYTAMQVDAMPVRLG